MNQPLGQAVGNSVEVLECVQLLRGEIDDRARPVLDLSIELAARMVMLVQLEPTLDEARARIRRVYESGDALECFRRNVEAQSGDPRVCDDPRKILPLTDKSFRVESPRSGFVAAIDTQEIGNAIAEAGGGRVRVEDLIDPKIGFMADMKLGDEVKAGDVIGTVLCDDNERGQRAVTRIQSAYSVSEDRPAELPCLIKEVIE
jgi:thymidine phosphorylase